MKVGVKRGCLGSYSRRWRGGPTGGGLARAAAQDVGAWDGRVCTGVLGGHGSTRSCISEDKVVEGWGAGDDMRRRCRAAVRVMGPTEDGAEVEDGMGKLGCGGRQGSWLVRRGGTEQVREATPLAWPAWVSQALTEQRGSRSWDGSGVGAAEAHRSGSGARLEEEGGVGVGLGKKDRGVGRVDGQVGQEGRMGRPKE